MMTYMIYRNDVDVVAVKDGFSYPGFFFTWIWAFVKKLWGVGIFFFLLNIMAFSSFLWMTHKASPAAYHLSALWITINFTAWAPKAILGYFGNHLRGNKLIRQGYRRLPGTIRAKNDHEAIIIGASLPANHQNNTQDGGHWTRWIGGTILVLWSFFLFTSPLPNMATYPTVQGGAPKNNNQFTIGHMLKVGNHAFPALGSQQQKEPPPSGLRISYVTTQTE
jgi:hypothetical protein